MISSTTQIYESMNQYCMKLYILPYKQNLRIYLNLINDKFMQGMAIAQLVFSELRTISFLKSWSFRLNTFFKSSDKLHQLKSEQLLTVLPCRGKAESNKLGRKEKGMRRWGRGRGRIRNKVCSKNKLDAMICVEIKAFVNYDRSVDFLAFVFDNRTSKYRRTDLFHCLSFENMKRALIVYLFVLWSFIVSIKY